MWIFKRLTRWWQEEYGGEYKAHADFCMVAGDTFALAFSELFANAAKSFWHEKVPPGCQYKVHLVLSISISEDDEETA